MPKYKSNHYQCTCLEELNTLVYQCLNYFEFTVVVMRRRSLERSMRNETCTERLSPRSNNVEVLYRYQIFRIDNDLSSTLFGSENV